MLLLRPVFTNEDSQGASTQRPSLVPKRPSFASGPGSPLHCDASEEGCMCVCRGPSLPPLCRRQGELFHFSCFLFFGGLFAELLVH